MNLPRDAIERALRPLYIEHDVSDFLQSPHSLPIGAEHWDPLRNALMKTFEDFVRMIEPPADRGFTSINIWAHAAASKRESIYSRIGALSPFKPFRVDAAQELLDTLERLVAASLRTIRSGSDAGPSTITASTVLDAWRQCTSEHSETTALRAAFDTPAVPIDARGSFRADWVLEHYAYDAARLWNLLLPHLGSLCVGGVSDVLVALRLIGDMLSSGQPILAFTTMNSFVRNYLKAPDEVRTQAQTHLLARQAALRQTDIAIRNAVTSERARESTEAFALALADAYRRIVEGPVRQYAWALRSLQSGTWERPPNVAELRDRLVSSGGFLTQVANDLLIVELRNSQAHETLEWDGTSNEFLTEDGPVPRERVIASLIQASAFSAGCQSAFAAAVSLQVEDDRNWRPHPDEAGRLPSWHRVLAYFGTNKIRVLDEELNTKTVSITVESLDAKRVNPCFQALITAHLLLPAVESFAVRIQGDSEAVITVSAEALAAAVPVWTHAVDLLDRMPFSTFLPANLDARRPFEDETVALKSTAWIAADDVLDAVDGSPDAWQEPERALIEARLSIAQLALGQTRGLAKLSTTRIDSVITSIRTLRRWLREANPDRARIADTQESILRLRHQWSAWGPVQRHPSVAPPSAPEYDDEQPRLSVAERTKAYQSL